MCVCQSSRSKKWRSQDKWKIRHSAKMNPLQSRAALSISAFSFTERGWDKWSKCTACCTSVVTDLSTWGRLDTSWHPAAAVAPAGASIPQFQEPGREKHGNLSDLQLIILLLFEFKETVGLLTNPKRSNQWPKINQKNNGKQARGYSQLPLIRWLYTRCSKAEWRAIG